MNNNPISEVYLMDCVAGMKEYPDKFFDLAICDPPYGIGAENGYGQSNNRGIHKSEKKWDSQTPKEDYFLELFRVSKNQIVFGANYFIDFLGNSRGFLIWDKIQQGRNFADCEFAWTSFDRVAKIIRVRYFEPHECSIHNTIKRIHPTQKPLKVYEEVLKNYASKGEKILDTHLGSGSSRIAAQKMGFDFYGFEIDPDYFSASEKRFKEAISMPLFDAVPAPRQLELV